MADLLGLLGSQSGRGASRSVLDRVALGQPVALACDGGMGVLLVRRRLSIVWTRKRSDQYRQGAGCVVPSAPALIKMECVRNRTAQPRPGWHI